MKPEEVAKKYNRFDSPYYYILSPTSLFLALLFGFSVGATAFSRWFLIFAIIFGIPLAYFIITDEKIAHSYIKERK